MRRRGTARDEEPVAPVNATPLIDVVLCMIVFFLLVGQLAEGQRLAMDLPEAVAGEEERPQRALIVNLVHDANAERDARPRIMVNGDGLTLETLRDRITESARAERDLIVELRAPRDTRYRWVEEVMDLCAEAGVLDVRLATSRAGAGR